MRVRVDERSESVGRKIRDAELAKLPYMLVVGDESSRRAEVAVRVHDEGDLGAMAVADARRITQDRRPAAASLTGVRHPLYTARR